MKNIQKWFIVCLFLIMTTACSTETGTLEFRANGEDFVRQGFVSVDGWSIAFDNVIIHLSDVTAYQTDPPYQSITGETPDGEAISLSDTFQIDLAEGSAEADPILVDSMSANAGQYNAISWEMVSGDNNATVQMVGTAVKDNTTISFNILIEDSYSYVCGEFVGDVRKGFVNADSTGDIEMTFHFDHLFGDGDSDPSEPLNVGALGFDPLAAIANNGNLEITQSELESQLTAEEYASLLDNLATLGHVGEGHCFEAQNGYTAHEE